MGDLLLSTASTSGASAPVGNACAIAAMSFMLPVQIYRPATPRHAVARSLRLALRMGKQAAKRTPHGKECAVAVTDQLHRNTKTTAAEGSKFAKGGRSSKIFWKTWATRLMDTGSNASTITGITSPKIVSGKVQEISYPTAVIIEFLKALGKSKPSQDGQRNLKCL